MPFIAVFGQMNIDIIYDDFGKLPEPGEEVFAKNFGMQLGGGPMLYPIVLNRMGINSKLGTFLADDLQSNMAKTLLKEMNFDSIYNFYNKKDGHPVVVTSVFSLDGERSFICYNEDVRESILSEMEVYKFLTGSKVTFAPIGFPNVLKKLQEEGTKIIFDTGWYEDLDIAMYEDILKYVDIFTPNNKEAMKMTKTSSVEDALKVLSKYVKHPIISLGEEGCLTYIRDEIIQVPMPCKFEAVDVTGAGDNFLAGIIYGLYHGWDIIECMKMGNVFGGYSTTELGCYKAMISLDIALEYMKKYEQI